MPCILEAIGNLFVKFIAVSYNDNSWVIRHILQYPLCQPHHHQALACTLRVPDDTALLITDTWFGGFKCKVLIGTAYFLYTAIIHNTIVD